ncbi:ABC transporter ATP-binding protein [Paraburkholderia megapolitana]|uniref:Carbohydrate ABC transporter ATP-binding protein, CUT1 family n=1 Tax=Paraburkholderia megapolitana TaxID=420953 RepID=A0A1I3D8Z7_9BURK|nr:ATP-binding cassette domain-containing protein [Paraburkholderia megapolitana]QDQ81730.1 ATP-binding cassette domain-containing protein [Paraburkholderia megapolitana]SFH83197.1 carbohydrate ABC transporter ATP-binding protein, CUT1 family [Paraburkholderia megapolitana]
MASIALKGVGKSYGPAGRHAAVVRNVDLEIAPGEFCVFVGASGCGKSTLLRMIAGLEALTTGDLFVGGRRMNDVPAAKRGIAMVFQSYALFPHMTVYENLSFGLTLAKLKKSVIDEKVHTTAQALQLEHLLDRLPKALSGGQRQRVAIGRALVRQPGVFLFDEPLSNLDASLRLQTRHEIARIHRGIDGASSIYVTHDQVEAMTLADRIVLLNAGTAVEQEGSIAQCGPPLELYHRPRNRFVAGFIGSPKMNFIAARLVSASEQHAQVRLDTGETLIASVDARRLQPGEALTLGIRPEHAGVGTGNGNGNGADAQHLVREVRWQERLGESTYVYLDSGDPLAPWVVKLPGNASADAGQRLPISIPATSLHVFDARGDALTRCTEDLALPMAFPH